MLSLAIPHKPCPLVQPFDSLVPNPTKNPATPYPIKLVIDAMSSLGPNG